MGMLKASVWALLRFGISYLLGVSIAAAFASIDGGSLPLLVGYTVAVGLPFFAAASLVGIIFQTSVFKHPLPWSLAAPLVTGAAWFGFGLSMGDLFYGPAVGFYAILCAGCSAGVFYVGLRQWPPADATGNVGDANREGL